MKNSVFRICEHCNVEYLIKFSESLTEIAAAMQTCPNCKKTDHIWIRIKKK